MKFTKEHTAILKVGIDKVLNNNPKIVEAYENGAFQRSESVKNLQTRFCFDLFHASGVKIGDGIGTQGDIVGDYQDTHILTALKTVCPVVVRKY